MTGENRARRLSAGSGVRAAVPEIRITSVLPGSMAMLESDGQTIIYLSADALECRDAPDLAHGAAHMLMGRDECDEYCGYWAGKLLRLFP